MNDEKISAKVHAISKRALQRPPRARLTRPGSLLLNMAATRLLKPETKNHGFVACMKTDDGKLALYPIIVEDLFPGTFVSLAKINEVPPHNGQPRISAKPVLKAQILMTETSYRLAWNDHDQYAVLEPEVSDRAVSEPA